MRTTSLVVVIGILLGVTLQLAVSVPAVDYKTAWVREHWSIDSIEPLTNGNRDERQFGGFGDLGKVVESVGKFDLKEVSKFLKEIPELFESVQTIVDGANTSFGEAEA